MTAGKLGPLCGGCEQRPAPKWRYRLPHGGVVPLCDPCVALCLRGVDQPALFDQDAPTPADVGRHPANGR